MKFTRRYVNTAMKMARQKEHIAFNTRCRRYHLVPKSLCIKPPVDTYEGKRIAQRAGFQFLNARINDNYRRFKVFSHDLFFQKRQLQHSLRPCHFTALESLVTNAVKRERSNTKQRQKKKFDSLLNRSRPISQKAHVQKWVINLSSKTLTDHQISVLSKGLNYAVTPTKIPTPDIVSTIESALRKVTPSHLAESARVRIIGLLQRPKLPASNITPDERKAILHLKQEKDIMILPSDKGRAVVVLDTAEYDNKIRTLLDDRSTYRIITKDPTPSLERKMNSILLSLHRDAQLPKQLYDKLRSTAGLIPRLYGLPKIHKSGRPLRPIVSYQFTYI